MAILPYCGEQILSRISSMRKKHDNPQSAVTSAMSPLTNGGRSLIVADGTTIVPVRQETTTILEGGSGEAQV
jgi:hypothetical protein